MYEAIVYLKFISLYTRNSILIFFIRYPNDEKKYLKFQYRLKWLLYSRYAEIMLFYLNNKIIDLSTNNKQRHISIDCILFIFFS